MNRGRTVGLASGGLTASVDPLGATLVRFDLAGEPLLSGPARVDAARGHHGAVLAPWPNRIDRGRYRFAGVDHALPCDDPAGHALHGLAFRNRWHVDAAGDDTVALSTRLGPSRGYPFEIALHVAYTLGRRGLTCAARWVNTGRAAAPFGLGFHPYLRPGPSPLSEWRLSVPATSVMDTDPRTRLPLPERSVTPTADFLSARPLGSASFSRAYRRASEDAVVRLHDPRGTTLSMRMSDSLPWVQVFTGDVPDPALRRRGVAIEPQTCPPNAFATGRDLLRLEPGEDGRAAWSIEVSDDAE